MRHAYKILGGKSEGKRPPGRHRHRWKIILKLILRNSVERLWIGFIWLRIRISGWYYQHGNEPSGFIKGGIFLDQLIDYQILNKDSTPSLLSYVLSKHSSSFYCVGTDKQRYNMDTTESEQQTFITFSYLYGLTGKVLAYFKL
jgi:hypothetical protein